MDSTLVQILSELVRAHGEIDQLRMQIANLEKQNETLQKVLDAPPEAPAESVPNDQRDH